MEVSGLRYINYIADAVSSAFHIVVNSNPKPGEFIKKLERVGRRKIWVGLRLIELTGKYGYWWERGSKTDKYPFGIIME